MDWIKKIAKGTDYAAQITGNVKKVWNNVSDVFGEKKQTTLQGGTPSPHLGAGIGRDMGGWSQKGRVRRGRHNNNQPYKPVARRPITPASQVALQSTIGGPHRPGKRLTEMGKRLSKIYNGKKVKGNQQRRISRLTKKTK
jgi:hypothetical protein